METTTIVEAESHEKECAQDEMKVVIDASAYNFLFLFISEEDKKDLPSDAKIGIMNWRS